METIEKSPRFKARLAISEPFENDLEAYLTKMGMEIIQRNGSERIISGSAELIRKMNDATARHIRFTPDFWAVDELGAFYAEAKASINIERGPYEHYMHLYSTGARLKLYIKPWPEHKNVYWNYIENVRFVESEIVVGRHIGKEFPIVDGWISPRTANRHAGRGSGTDFKEIDFDSIIRIRDFYDDGPNIEVTKDPDLNRQRFDLF